MIGLLQSLLGGLGGLSFSTYLIIGLSLSNVTTGWLLKNAWEKNAQAITECENIQLRDALTRIDETNQELIASQRREAVLERELEFAGREADRVIELRLMQKDLEHEKARREFEMLENEVTDDEFFCATEPVAVSQLDGMRREAERYNRNRNRESAGPEISVRAEEPPPDL